GRARGHDGEREGGRRRGATGRPRGGQNGLSGRGPAPGGGPRRGRRGASARGRGRGRHLHLAAAVSDLQGARGPEPRLQSRSAPHRPRPHRRGQQGNPRAGGGRRRACGPAQVRNPYRLRPVVCSLRLVNAARFCSFGQRNSGLPAFRTRWRPKAERRRAMVPFFVQIKCRLGQSYEVANKLADAELASEIYSTAGDFDLLVKFYVEVKTDIGHFVNEKVQTIPGIQDTRTIITFKAF